MKAIAHGAEKEIPSSIINQKEFYFHPHTEETPTMAKPNQLSKV